MDDFTKILIGASFSLVTVVIGWTLNQLSQWLKARVDDKKCLKIVLFNLLEAYFLFIRNDFDHVVTKVAESVSNKIPQDQKSSWTPDAVRDMYMNAINRQLKPDLNEQIANIGREYQLSIKALASVDPFLAYYLSGRVNVFDVFDSIAALVNEVKGQFPNISVPDELAIRSALEGMKKGFTSEALQDHEDDIRTVARKISLISWIQAIVALRRIKSNRNKNIENDIEDWLSKMMHQNASPANKDEQYDKTK